jgi:hypothetical protein
VPFGTPDPVAQYGAGPSIVKSIAIPSAAAARSIAS